MKVKILIIAALIAVAAFIALSQIKAKAFAPARDFPRGALVYVQINDLPALIKLCNESKFMEKYAASENFARFQNNHLGRKLASRWKEFGDASGFSFDSKTISGLAENKAAIALYDIGKLEFVFIAPMSEEIFAATKFLQNREKFTGETIDGETKIYRVSVEADRGRQRQELIFTNLKGRFVLATSEKLIVQTLRNIDNRETKNRLSDEPAFASLSEKISPHTAAVWVDQSALNTDYYFRRYWLMSDISDLENIRAGIFDFEIQQEKIVERRKFLLNKAESFSRIKTPVAEKLLSNLPADVPFYHLQTAGGETIYRAVRETIFDRAAIRENVARKDSHRYSFDDFDDDDWRDYSFLSEKYDEIINDAGEDETTEKAESAFDFSKPFQAARPQAVLTFSEPEVSPAPRFIEFRRAAIFHLASPELFNQNEFETEIARMFAGQTMILAPDAKFVWETKSENGLKRRELNLPMLGWNASYVLRGSEIILTNRADFSSEISIAENEKSTRKIAESLTELTALDMTRKESAFDVIFAELTEKKIAGDFFTGNIASLLEVMSEVEKIEVARRYSPNLLEEEVVASFKR